MNPLRKSVLIGLAAAILMVVVASPFDGFAASTPVNTRTLARGAATVPRCDTDGTTVSYNLTGNNVTGVAVAGINAACATGTLSVVLRSGATTSTGSATVPAGGGSMVVTLAPAIALGQAMTTFVSISGP